MGDTAPVRVCDDLRVKARVRDPRNGGWGLHLEFRDPDGELHRLIEPNEVLHGDSSEAVRSLAREGLHIEPGKSANLREYLLAIKPRERVRIVQQTGWHGDEYLTPEEIFSCGVSEQVRLEDTPGPGSSHGRKDNAQSWRENVGALAEGNTRLVLAICCGLAGPLLKRVEMESGGLHFVGGSSLGKTTALWLAASLFGHPERAILTWRATANGLEGVAARHNNGLLILDKLSQCDPKEAGAAAYMLANGKGKARASRTGGAREAASWRLLLLSSGEVSLATHLESAGKRANAGQELRLVNIPADAGAGMGMFENLHGHESPSAFANALKAACAAHHGTAQAAFLRKLMEDFAETGSDADSLTSAIEDFVGEVVPPGASGQCNHNKASGLLALLHPRWRYQVFPPRANLPAPCSLLGGEPKEDL